MNEWLKDGLISLGIVGLILVIGVPALELVDDNRQGCFIPCNSNGYITCAGDGWVFFYPVVDSDIQLLGNYSLADGVYFNSSLAPCHAVYTISWGVITSIRSGY